MWGVGDIAVVRRDYVCNCGRTIRTGETYRVEAAETYPDESDGLYLVINTVDDHSWWHEHFRKVKPASKDFAAQMRNMRPAPAKPELEQA